MNRKDQHYNLANVKAESSLLMARRAWWSAAKTNIPRFDGKIIAPDYIPLAHRDKYRKLWSDWWDGLDPKAQKFLGVGYQRIAKGIRWKPGDQ